MIHLSPLMPSFAFPHLSLAPEATRAVPGAAGSKEDPIPELAPTHPMAEGSIPLLEIKSHVLGYQRGGLFIMSAVKLVHTLVKCHFQAAS